MTSAEPGHTLQTMADQQSTDETAGKPPKQPRLRSLAPRFVRRRPALHVTWRVAVFFVGVAILVAGLAMIFLPGPGWGGIIVGLAVLATEFVWAQRALLWARRQAIRAKERALDPAHRRRNLAIALVAGLVVAGGGAAFLWWRGLPW